MEEQVKKCNDFHDKAMSLADKAFDAQTNKKDFSKALDLYRSAFENERQAAMILAEKTDTEPSRSVLFRSAAWLAIQAELPNEAIRMAAFGLSGHPPSPIDKELREVMAKALVLVESATAV